MVTNNLRHPFTTSIPPPVSSQITSSSHVSLSSMTHDRTAARRSVSTSSAQFQLLPSLDQPAGATILPTEPWAICCSYERPSEIDPGAMSPIPAPGTSLGPGRPWRARRRARRPPALYRCINVRRTGEVITRVSPEPPCLRRPTSRCARAGHGRVWGILLQWQEGGFCIWRYYASFLIKGSSAPRPDSTWYRAAFLPSCD
jgi:hypothetical protein